MSSRPRQLRQNSTIAENRLWYVLRNRGLDGQKFVRQLAVGPDIADFACREIGLIIELDGGQHARGARAAAASQVSRLAPSILLPVGEKVARPQGETDEGVLRA